MKKIIFILLVVLIIPTLISAQPFVLKESISDMLENVKNGGAYWADYDHDGDYDILITGTANDEPFTQLYKNINGNDFQLVSTALPQLEFSAVLWSDLDNDNDLELILMGTENASITNGHSQINSEAFLFENLGDDNFQNKEFSFPGLSSASMDSGDLDNDGDLDIVIMGTNGEEPLTKLFINNGNFEFVQDQSMIPNFHKGEIAFADYDNDFDLDVLISGFFIENNFQTKGLKLFRNDGDLIFTEIFSGLIGLSESNVCWADYDADGDLDILANGSTDAPTHLVYIYNNEGNDFFANIGIEIFGTINGSLVWGDYDTDGDSDFFLNGYASYSNEPIVEIYRNLNGSLFNKVDGTGLPPLHLGNTSWCDFDNDGDMDLLMCGEELSGIAKTSLYENKNTLINNVPSVPINLSSEINENTVILNWDKAFDMETSPMGLTYNLRVGSSSGSSDVFSGMTSDNENLLVPKHGNVYQNIGWEINSLEAGTYYYAVQSVDASFKSSPFSDEATFQITSTTLQEDNKDDFASFSFTCFPNPFSDIINIEINSPSDKEIEISLLNNEGKFIELVYKGKIPSGKSMLKKEVKTIEGFLNTGIFIIQVKTENQKESRIVLLEK